jgi:hypothetical protein
MWFWDRDVASCTAICGGSFTPFHHRFEVQRFSISPAAPRQKTNYFRFKQAFRAWPLRHVHCRCDHATNKVYIGAVRQKIRIQVYWLL